MSRATRTPTAPATASQAQKLPQRPPPPRGGRPSSWTSRGFLFGVTRSASLAGAGGTASPAQSADDGTLAIQDEGWVYSPGSVALLLPLPERPFVGRPVLPRLQPAGRKRPQGRGHPEELRGGKEEVDPCKSWGAEE